MPSAFVAPWQSLNPLSFLEAAKAGAELGQRIKAEKNQTDLGYYGINSANRRASDSLNAEQSMFNSRQDLAKQELDRRTAAQELQDQIDREKMLQEAGLAGRRLDLMETADANRTGAAADRIDAQNRRTDLMSPKQPLTIEEQARQAAGKKLLQDGIATNDPAKLAEAHNILQAGKIPNVPDVVQYRSSLNPFSMDSIDTGVKSDIPSPASLLQAPQNPLLQTQQPQAKVLSPAEKAVMANQISAKNPTLSREEILDLVNKL